MRRAASILVIGLVAATIGCSDTTGDSSPFATPAPAPSSTAPPRQGTLVDPADEISAPSGASPAEIRAGLEEAVADENTCDLVAALNEAVPDVADPAAVIAVYRTLAETTEAAGDFIPAPLAEDWVIVVAATSRAVDAADRSGGDIADPALRAAFDTAELTASLAAIDAWTVENCT